MLFGILKDLKFAIIRPMFTPGTVREEILGTIQEKLEAIANWLGQKEYLMGDNVTYVDFVLYEMVLQLDWLTNQALYTENEGKYALF